MSTVAELSREQLLERIAQLESGQKSAGTGLKISMKGAISFYGNGRFPQTMYASQWRRVIQLVKEGTIEKFLADNKGKYAEKPSKDEAAS